MLNSSVPPNPNNLSNCQTTPKEVLSNVNTDKGANLPMIEVIMTGTKFKTLIDSGSSISILCPTVFEKVKTVQKLKYIARHCQILTMTGSKVEYVACVTINLKIGNQNLCHDFFVAKQPFPDTYKAILGYDLFQKHLVHINFEKKTLKIKNAKVPLLEGHENSLNLLQIEEYPVSLKRKVTLNPGETQVIELVLGKNTIPNDTEVMFEPKILHNKWDLQPSISNTTDNGICTVITNLETDKLTLNKHMKLGTIHLDFEENIELPTNSNSKDSERVNLITASEETIQLRKQEFNIQDFELSHLSGTDKVELEDLLQNYTDVFSSSLKTLGETDAIQPSIQMLNDLPVACHPYPIPIALRPEAKRIISELLETGIISESTSNYAAPMLLVRKRSRETISDAAKGIKPSYRTALDMRLLNSKVVKVPIYPPKISDIINELSGNKLWCSCDLQQAFWQIRVPEEMREKLAFTTIFGNYSFSRLCYGFVNSPAFFISLMNECFKDVGPGVYWYLDDLLVGGNDFEQMIERLERVFCTLKRFNLTLSPKKCRFAQTEIDFLGYNISQKGVSPIDKNLNKIIGFPVPNTVRQLKRFLGVAGFYRHMIKDYSTLSGVLECMTGKNKKFKWTTECEQAFKNLQQKFFEKPFLIQPDITKKFYLNTDASAYSISSILAHKINGELRPVSYFSRRLTSAQAKYPSIKLELFSIVESIKHFRNYLFNHFVVLTDHKPLEYHKKLQNPTSIVCNWLLYLQNFDFTVKHIAGKKMFWQIFYHAMRS